MADPASIVRLYEEKPAVNNNKGGYNDRIQNDTPCDHGRAGGRGISCRGRCSRADGLDDIKAAKKLRVAIDLGLPPYGMTDDKMQPTGSDVETGKLLAEDLGAQFELVPTTGASRIPSLQSGKADVVISTLSVTPERAKAIDFSVAYASLRTVVAGIKSIRSRVRPISTARPSAPRAAPPTTPSSPRTPRTPRSCAMRTTPPRRRPSSAARSICSPPPNCCWRRLASKSNRQPELKFVIDTFKLAIGVKKDEARLLQTVSDWVKTNLKNGKLNAIYKKYHGTDLPDVIVNGT